MSSMYPKIIREFDDDHDEEPLIYGIKMEELNDKKFQKTVHNKIKTRLEKLSNIDESLVKNQKIGVWYY